jgi:peptide/nickel transport system permease protein
MTRFILRRLLFALPLLLGIGTVTFFIVRLAPGDPLQMYLDDRSQREIPPEVVEAIRVRWGLDQPLPVQYVRWVRNTARGDLGESFRYRRPVAALIAERIPWTLQLTTLALLLDALLGISLGVISAVRQYTRLDRAITLVSLVIYSVPGFWLALMLVLVFSVQLGWLPTSLPRSLDYDLLTPGEQIADRIRHLVLPVFVLGVASAAGTARYVRSRLLEVLSEEYVLAARGRGLPEHRVITRHALRNALIPLITIYGMSLPFLFGGAVLIENVFAWPGMGTLAVEAVAARDYPLILATGMVAAVLVVLGNVLADVLYAVADPRVGYARRQA